MQLQRYYIAFKTIVDNYVGTAAGLVNSIGSDEPLSDFTITSKYNNQDFEARLEEVLSTLSK